MYKLVYGLIYLISLLPLRMLYLLFDAVYLIVFYVAGYRKAIVLQNLKIAFPEKTDAERKSIAKKFYRNLTDTIAETIKLISADENFVRKHFEADYSLLDKPYKEGKKCQLHLGHNFNWELGVMVIPLYAKQKVLAIYMPLKNKILDRILIKFRSKTGAILLPATQLRTAIVPWRHEPYVLGLIADQNPGHPKNAFWVKFFGRPTPFVRGPENGARAGNLTVIFCHITKMKRGYYQGFAEVAEENPASLEKGALTKRYAEYLERVIRANPEMWLWSHRRWKHEWKPEYGPVIE